MISDALALDADRLLALSYAPVRHRAPLRSLWQLDARLAGVVARGGEPVVTQMKLAWWREALCRLDFEPAPGEPALEALTTHLLPAGLRGADVAGITEGWEFLLASDLLSAADLAGYAVGRGSTLFRLSAQLVGASPTPQVGRAGEAWALIDLARKNSKTAEIKMALEAAALSLAEAPDRWPATLRPLGILTMLARRDDRRGIDRFERQGSPARMLRILGYRLTGR